MSESNDPLPARGRHLVFVVGCPRSGTSWVRSIFAAHAGVVSGGESHLFPTLFGALTGRTHPSERKAAALATYDRWARGEIGVGGGPRQWVNRERLCELLDEFLLRTDDDAARMAAAEHVLGRVLEEYAMANHDDPNAVLVEKTPGHLYYTQTLLEWWPTARVVEVIRDGRDVCVSLQYRSVVRAWAPADRIDQISQWVRAVRHGASVRPSWAAMGRWLSIHYEALAADPCEQIRRLLAFAGLPAEKQLVDQIVAATAFSVLSATGPRQHRRKGIVGDYRKHFSDADHRLFRELAGDVFEAAGYRF